MTNHRQYVHIVVKGPNNYKFCFTAVYGSPQARRRKDLWGGLRNILIGIRDPWIVSGDFNAFLDKAEKRGGSVWNSIGCRKFKAWVRDYDMRYMGFTGTKLTWKRGLVQERLDRFLCNDEWYSRMGVCCVMHLPCLQSDHCPVMLHVDRQDGNVQKRGL